MRWRKARRSDNVVIARGGGRMRRGFRLGGGGGIIGILVILAISWFTGTNPLSLLGMLGGGGMGQAPSQPAQTTPASGQNNEQVDFVRAVVGSTEDVWGAVFQQGGRTYAKPTLVVFNGFTTSACGAAQSAMGPFYCPGDQKVYLDLGFFQQMTQRYHAAGDFARAYVIAHEVGHHVQNLLGIFAEVDKARSRGAEMQGAAGLSVRQELQADCFAGVWANHAQQRLQWLQPGDIEEAMTAASAVGDDTLQEQSRGHAVPDSFTHGSSEQRMRWFRAGFESGDLGSCDTFSARSL